MDKTTIVRHLALALVGAVSSLAPSCVVPPLAAQVTHKPLHATEVVLPKPGTRFINTYYVTDSLGALVPKRVVDAEMGDDTQFVVKSGVWSHGRSNCITLTGPGHGDTNVISFAKSGDIYLLNTNHGEKWNRLPFGFAPGKILKTDPIPDTGTMLGKHYEMMDHRELYVVGHDTSSIAGKVYDCIKLRMIEVKIFEGKEYANGTTYWFAPAIGYFVRENFGWGGSYFLNQQAIDLRPAP